MSAILPDPYVYSPDDWLAVPDLTTGSVRYWPMPCHKLTRQLVSEEFANYLLRTVPGAYGDLIDTLPDGVRDDGDRRPTDLDLLAGQNNVISRYICTGGYTQPKFWRTTQALAVAVINPALLADSEGGTISLERLEVVGFDDLLMMLISNAKPATILALCSRLSSAGCGSQPASESANYLVADLLELIVPASGSTTPTTPTPTPTPTPSKPILLLRVEINDCDRVAGWIIDSANPKVAQSVDVFINDKLVATVTASKLRDDVAKTYGGDVNSLYGFEWIKPASLRNGTTHKTRVFARDAAVEAEYAGSIISGPCGTPPSDPTPPPVRVIQYRIDGPFSVPEQGGDKLFWVTERLSAPEGAERRRTGVSNFRLKENDVPSLVMTPTANSAEVILNLASIDKTIRRTLVAEFPEGGSAEMPIELVDTSCHRPSGQDYKPLLVWNAVPEAGGNARTFDTLDDANNTLGKHFDNTTRLNLSGSTFAGEMANYNVGTDVYLYWSPAVDSCAHVSDGIYYVLNGDGSNGQKLAIQVVNGKIAAVKPTDYKTPAGPQPPNSSLSAIAFGYTGVNDQYSGDLLVFAKNGTQPASGMVDTSTVPTTGFSNGSQTLDDNTAMSTIDNYLSQASVVPRWVPLLQAAQQAGYSYVGRGSGIDNPGEAIRYRVRGNKSEAGSKEYTFITPSYDVTVGLTQLYPAP